MHNTFPETVDVTNWIVKQKYKPIYCKGDIVKLINPTPYNLTSRDSVIIKDRLLAYVGQNNKEPVDHIHIDKIRYEYSYLPLDSLVDVYSISYVLKDTSGKVFFKYLNKDVYGDFDPDGWVMTECD